MQQSFEGRIWLLGDDIDTDIIIPTEYLALPTIQAMVPYAFAPLRSDLAQLIQPGDVLVAGHNFGCGSSREQAPEVLRALGLSCVVAKSYARIFYRNAINNGLPVFENAHLADEVEELQTLTVFPGDCLRYQDKKFPLSPLDDNVLQILENGGLVPTMRIRNKLTPSIEEQ